eukprot:Pgem_evm1s18268
MGGEDTLSKYLSELYPQKFNNLTSERIDKFQNVSQCRGFLKRKGKGGFASFCSDIVDLFDFDEDTATNMEPKVYNRRRLQLKTLQKAVVSLPGGNTTPKRRKQTLRQGLCVGVPVFLADKSECKTCFPRKFKLFDADPDDNTDNRPFESVTIKKKQKISCSRCGRQGTNIVFCKVCKRKLCIDSNNNFLRKKGEGGENILAQPFLHPVRHIEDDVHFLNSCFLIEHGDLSSGAIHKHMKEVQIALHEHCS